MRTLRVLAFAAACLGGATLGQTQIVLKPTGEDGIKLRIRALKVDAKIDSQIATTNLTLTFQNPTQGNEEAEFIYALPPDTVVTSFAYYFNDERVPAKVAEKERAAAIYKHITTRRRDPALIEMTGKRTFRARIFPVAPTADLRVEMTLVQALPNRKGSFTYNLPLKRAKGEPFDDLDVTVTAPKYSSENNLGLKPTLVAPVVERYQLAGKSVRPDRDLRIRFKPRSAESIDRDMFSGRSGGRDGFFVLFLTPNKGRSLSGPVTFLGGRVYGVRTSANSARPGDGIIVTGRYREAGPATVRWGGAETHVTFSGVAVPNHPAVKLWAAREIEALGSNRKQVVALSMRHNLPSRFTSWIAIPIAERKQYRIDKLYEVQSRLAVKYVQALGRDFEATPRSRAIQAQLSNISKEIGSNSNWQIQQALNGAKGQLANLVARDELDGRKNVAARQRLTRLTQHTGEDLNEVIRQSTRLLIGKSLWQYAEAIQAGNENTSQGKVLARRIHRANEQGLVPKRGLERTVHQMVMGQAYRIAGLRVGGKWVPASALEPIQRLTKFSKENPDERIAFAVSQLAYGEASQQLWVLRDNAATGKMQSPAADQARRNVRKYLPMIQMRYLDRFEAPVPEIQELARRIGRAKFENRSATEDEARLKTLAQPYAVPPELFVHGALREIYESMRWDLYNEESRSRLDEEKLAKLRASRDRLRDLGISTATDDYRFVYDVWWEESQARMDLLTEMRKDHPDPVRLASFGKELGTYASYRYLHGVRLTEETWEERNRAYNEVRIERLQTDVLLDKLERETPSPSVEAERKRLEARAQELRARMGDPLLTFDAPADAQRVVAIMPDGEVKPMAWVPLRNRWEVRFDVPAGAKEGEIEVQIVAVLKNGTRATGRSTYHVDVTPPQGSARIVALATGFRLEISGSPDLGRVTAVLPNGEEVNVPRQSEGRFMLTVPHLAKGDRVKFVLFDRAHNRAEVEAVAP